MDKPTTQNSVKPSATIFKILRDILRFSLLILSAILEGSLKAQREAYKPTSYEIMCGEKLPFTGKYFTPDDK